MFGQARQYIIGKERPQKGVEKGKSLTFATSFLPSSWPFAFYDIGLDMYSSHIVHIKTKIRQITNFSTNERGPSVVPLQTRSLILHPRTSSFVEIFNCFFKLTANTQAYYDENGIISNFATVSLSSLSYHCYQI